MPTGDRRDRYGALAGLAEAGRPPDIIVSDYRLRDRENGIDVIMQIRDHYRLDIPGILVSGDTGPELLREAKEKGLRILHKPVRPAKLRALIEHLVSPARNEPIAPPYRENIQ